MTLDCDHRLASTWKAAEEKNRKGHMFMPTYYSIPLCMRTKHMNTSITNGPWRQQMAKWRYLRQEGLMAI